MRKLLFKDLILNKFTFLTFGATLTAVAVLYGAMGMPAGLYFAVTGLMSAFFPISALGQEEKSNMLVLNRSLPVRAAEFVLSKYVGSWLVALAGLAYCLAIGVLMPWSQLHALGFASLNHLALALSILGFTIAFFYPFTLRFGFMGVMIMMVALQLLGVVVLFLASMFRTALNLRGVIDGTIQTVQGAKEALGDPLFYAALVGLALALNVLSFFASWRLFASRDL